MENPTMIYSADDKEGTEGYGYWYKVVDAEEVEDELKKGWFATPSELPKKRGRKKAE